MSARTLVSCTGLLACALLAPAGKADACVQEAGVGEQMAGAPAQEKPPVKETAKELAAPAQETGTGEQATGGPADARKQAAAASGEVFSVEQLEQIVAPIALYPDSLLTQIMLAATYPLEIVEAARWVEKNAKLKGEQLDAALQKETWDPSVKSLCAFGDVLKRMNDNLDWTQDLGDAFLGQQAEVMDTVQNMRRKAYDAGNLKSGKEITVTEQTDKIIVIEAAQPEVVYVPTYYPTAVYGGWGYPYYYYPPMYPPAPAGGVLFGFTVGVIWGSAWGGCSWGWGHTEIDIDVDNYNNFIDRTESGDRRQQAKDRAKSGDLKHDPSHRKGVGYKDSKVAQKYGGSPGSTRISRDQARGYGDRTSAGTRDVGGSSRDLSGGTRDVGGSSRDLGGSSRDVSRSSSSTRSSASSSTRSSGQRSSSFSGSQRPSLDRASSSRGSVSRGSMGSRGGGGRGRR